MWCHVFVMSILLMNCVLMGIFLSGCDRNDLILYPELEPPDDFKAVSNDGQIVLVWSSCFVEGKRPDFQGYTIFKSFQSLEGKSITTLLQDTVNVKDIEIDPGDSTLYHYMDDGIDNGTKVYYKLMARSEDQQYSKLTEQKIGTPRPDWEMELNLGTAYMDTNGAVTIIQYRSQYISLRNGEAFEVVNDTFPDVYLSIKNGDNGVQLDLQGLMTPRGKQTLLATAGTGFNNFNEVLEFHEMTVNNSFSKIQDVSGSSMVIVKTQSNNYAKIFFYKTDDPNFRSNSPLYLQGNNIKVKVRFAYQLIQDYPYF